MSSNGTRMEPSSYTVITKEICKTWSSSGKADILAQFGQLYQASKKERQAGHKLRKLLHELVWRYLGEYISTEDMSHWFGMAGQEHPEIQSILVDVLIVVDAECSLEENEEHKTRLAKVTQLVSKMGCNRLLQERLDLETGTLEKATVIQNQKKFQQAYIRMKTRLFFKQQKFNLLREEIEGYSKLATELYECKKPEETLENIKSLIGCFNMDPNRVLDICLEWLEHSVSNPAVARKLISNYLRLCDSSTLTNLLGFKFQFYATAPQGTPESLYKTAGVLLQSGLVQLGDLFPHLSPTDEEIKAEHEKVIAASIEKVRKMGVVQLGEKKKEEAEVVMDYQNNQKFGLVRALVELGSWETSQEIIARYPQYCAVSDERMAKAITKRCHQIIEPLYRSRGAKKFGTAHPLEISIPAKMVVNSFEDFHSLLLPTLQTLGPMLSVDPLLFTKIVRVLRAFFKEYRYATEQWRTENRKIFATFLCLMEEVLLPTLSLLDCPAVQSEEIWQIFKALNYEMRYRLYGYWKNSSFKLHPKLIMAQAKAVDRTKYVLKRLTKDTVKQSGRQLGKISHANPGALFDTILIQIQRYDNLIGPVVDTLKYLTSLSYDILLYCVIEALANPEKEQMKTDGTTISDWLQSLANFCGTVCKKYSIDLGGLLQYVANKLKSGNSLDLLLLKEVVQKMSGIEANVEVTDDQLFALSGGEMLRTEGGYFGQIRNVKKPSSRLRETLIDHKLALPLCLLMSTHRAHIVFKEGIGQHLKLVGKLTDQCHDTLFQFGGFLSTTLNMDEYMKQVPPIEVLIEQYGTPWDVAFFISRQMYNHQIQNKYESNIQQQNAETENAKAEIFIDCADNILLPIAKTVESMHTENVWQDINPNFYTAFWTMTMYDISTPSSSYKKEIKKIKEQIDQLDNNSELNSGKRKREKERLQTMVDKLGEEQVTQEEHRLQVFGRLRNQCENWFPARTTKNDAITTFLRLCLFPRSVFSALDAQYCARMVQLIHELRIPNFSTLLCYDRVFTDISYIVASLTENEASRFGRFLCGMLSTVMRWHSDPEIYDKECGDFPGFITVVRTTAKSTEGGTRANQLDYENYRHVCHKWQYKLTKALVLCLESGEYIQIRNGLMILTKILQFFPMVHSLGTALEKRVEKVRNEEKDKRQDLYALAMGYAGQLKGRKSAMVPENEFHTKDASKPAPPMSALRKKKTAKKDEEKEEKMEVEERRSESKPTEKKAKTMREKIEEARKKREAGIAKELPKEDKDDDDDRDEKRKRAKSPESQEKLPKRAKTEEKDQDEKKEEKREKSSAKLERVKDKSKSRSRVRSRDRSESTNKDRRSRR